MAHGQGSRQLVQDGFIEHMGHQSHILVQMHAIAVKCGNARGFLAPMLKRKQTKIGQSGHVFGGSIDAKDPTGFFGLIGSSFWIDGGRSGRLGSRNGGGKGIRASCFGVAPGPG